MVVRAALPSSAGKGNVLKTSNKTKNLTALYVVIVITVTAAPAAEVAIVAAVVVLSLAAVVLRSE